MAADPYAWWREALTGKGRTASADDPQCGFYRRKLRQGGYQPVAFYPLYDGPAMSIACRVGDVDIASDNMGDVWNWCCQHPIPEEVYRAVAERGEAWPDMDESVQTQIDNRGIGDNSGDVDAFAELADQVASAAKGAKAYAKVESEEQAQRAQSLRSRLLELKGNADKARKKLADPLYQQWRDINTKWKPVIDEADEASGIVTRGLNAYATAQLKAQREAEEAAAAVQATDATPPTEPVQTAPTQIKGAYGRAASVKQTWELKEITDLDKVYQHFKGSAAVKECLQKLAAKAIKDGGEVPGTIREEVAKIK